MRLASDSNTGGLGESDGAPLAPIGDGGRDAATGRFRAGNPGGKGNPHALRVAAYREAMISEATPDDLRAIVRTLIEAAKGGDVQAAKEVLDRTLGKTAPMIDLTITSSTDGMKLYGFSQELFDAV